MITPEQKQAWREEYLEEMRNVSQEAFPIKDFQGLFDENDIGDRIFLTIIDTLIPFLNTLGYYIQNNPFFDDPSELAYASEENRLSLPDLFEYLTGMSRYGCDMVLSKVPGFEEPLFSAVQDNDKKRFLRIVEENGLDFSEICLEVGEANATWWYMHDTLSSFAEMFQAIFDDDIEEDDLEEKYKAFQEKNEEDLNQLSLGATSEALLGRDINFNMLIKEISSIDIPADENTLSLYVSEILCFYMFLMAAQTSLAPEERKILTDVLLICKYGEVINDIERLIYILYGFSGGELYCLENTEDLDRIREDYSEEIQAACVDPFQAIPQLTNTSNDNPQL